MGYVVGGLVALGIVVAALIYVRVIAKRNRDAFKDLAQELGWRYLGGEAGPLQDSELAGFRIAEVHPESMSGDLIENHMSGAWEGMDVAAGHCGCRIDRRTLAAFTFTVAANRSPRPHLLISTDPLMKEVGRRLQLPERGRASERLAPGAAVLSSDDASDEILNEQVLTWMRPRIRKFSFELQKETVAAYTRSTQPEDLPATVEVLREFCDHLERQRKGN